MRTPLLSLFGAYTAFAEPLTPRPLVVELVAFVRRSSSLGGVVTCSAFVHAEGLAERVPALARFFGRARGVECRVSFDDDAGCRHELDLKTELRGPVIRSLTELSGCISNSNGVPIAKARVRLNWRARGPR